MHNPQLIPKKHPMLLPFGQVPLTRFKDYKTTIKVDLIKSDTLDVMLDATFDFVKATWSEDGKESSRASQTEKIDAINQMLEGKALQLGLETVQFIFRISGITRIDTHQIVRQRIGVTFSQQCTGDRFLHHNDVLVERAISNKDELYDEYIESSLRGKMTYAKMCDSDVSMQAARAILPQNLETFIFMKLDLGTLLMFYRKRIDIGSQTWQMNEISRQMAEEVCKKFPMLQKVFDKYKDSFKFQKMAASDRSNTFSTSLYLPEPDDYDYHRRDYVYQMTKSQMHEFDLIKEDRFFWGTSEIDELIYTKIFDKYKQISLNANHNHWDNGEIFRQNIKARIEIENDYFKDEV